MVRSRFSDYSKHSIEGSSFINVDGTLILRTWMANESESEMSSADSGLTRTGRHSHKRKGETVAQLEARIEEPRVWVKPKPNRAPRWPSWAVAGETAPGMISSQVWAKCARFRMK